MPNFQLLGIMIIVLFRKKKNVSFNKGILDSVVSHLPKLKHSIFVSLKGTRAVATSTSTVQSEEKVMYQKSEVSIISLIRLPWSKISRLPNL